ncbi:thioesterase family protein (macronuclear) [Tetrahymena thermophila SB210]|uniref:Thioesterase family protein n=1 Tax=Tetrahymena thermophila (strain SB210) TaxID=312017 RepID=W7WZI2_TETTS|nr:thioesterase family protein [Tetrahymena thermophila SB210]EWS71007.1 thioesterase family protein [Tetrahymena thermophila SB210]|eukprot:XP_012656448.1 thioesterase family protein [Tetrahymena thermophila SB210]
MKALFKGTQFLYKQSQSFKSLQFQSKRFFNSQEIQFLQLKSNMHKVQHNEIVMRVKDEDLRLLNEEENRRQPIIKNFFTTMNEDFNIKIYEHKNINHEDKNVSYPRNSYYKVVFPLEKNTMIRDRFTNYFSDGLRYGRILEVLDYIAAYISYRHCYTDIGQRHVTNVTACVDNMNFYSQMKNDKDLEVQGYITYAGTSSMEIQLDLFQEGDLKASALFLMVARDANDRSKSYQVPVLKFEGEQDIQKCQLREHLGVKNTIKRKKEKLESLQNKPPNQQEIFEIHQFFSNKNQFLAEQKDQQSIQISATTFDKNLLMHKQDRNIHGNIFGGHLMREAMEMGWLAALIHSKGDYPLTCHVDDFQFLKPVAVGSIINFEAKLGYVVKNIMQVVVNCSIVDTNKCRTKSNDLHITLVAPKTVQLPKVIPYSYEEAMIYLDCKRRLDKLLF